MFKTIKYFMQLAESKKFYASFTREFRIRVTRVLGTALRQSTSSACRLARPPAGQLAAAAARLFIMAIIDHFIRRLTATS